MSSKRGEDKKREKAENYMLVYDVSLSVSIYEGKSFVHMRKRIKFSSFSFVSKQFQLVQFFTHTLTHIRLTTYTRYEGCSCLSS